MEPVRLSELIHAYAQPLTIYARQWSPDPSDLVQQAFLQLFELHDEPDHPQAWLYRVVRNLAVSEQRSNSRRQRREFASTSQNNNWFESSTADKIDGHAATAVLKTLPDNLREVLICRIWGDLTFDEIAELMDASSSSVHRWYQEGLRQIQNQLGIQCPNTNS